MIDRSARLWPQLSGIWTVAPQGGLAHLLVGTAAGVREAKMPANSPLLGATHWRLSPDGRRIATDPDRGLWVASSNGTHGTFLPAAMPRGCDMAQYQ
jgi:hypothetical protein